MNCPCCSGDTYEKCCGPFLSGKALPDTAEKLMRSRYTAYTRADIDYIKRTMAPEGKKGFDEVGTKQWAVEAKWKGLKIVNTRNGGLADTQGMVEFTATYEKDGEGLDHHEVAQFRKTKEGQWLFVDGDAHTHKEGEEHKEPPPKPVTHIRTQPKVGRNDICTCGSGKKYKKCCEGKAAP